MSKRIHRTTSPAPARTGPAPDPGSVIRYCATAPGWRGGWRLCVVVAAGRKWAQLLDTGSLATYTVAVAEIAGVSPVAVNAARLARRLVARCHQAERLGLFGGEVHAGAARRRLCRAARLLRAA